MKKTFILFAAGALVFLASMMTHNILNRDIPGPVPSEVMLTAATLWGLAFVAVFFSAKELFKRD